MTFEHALLGYELTETYESLGPEAIVPLAPGAIAVACVFCNSIGVVAVVRGVVAVADLVVVVLDALPVG